MTGTVTSCVANDCHVSPVAGHGGAAATMNRIEDSYWWPGLKTFVNNYVASCNECQRRKTKRGQPLGSMYHYNVIQPLQMMAFDCLGPSTESLDKKKQSTCSRNRHVLSLH